MLKFVSEVPVHQCMQHGEMSRKNKKSVCSHRATNSLQSQRHGGTAHMTGMLSRMATHSLGKTGQQGEVVELVFM